MPVEIRDYRPADEQDWLRCRVLSFLNTAYFDDVMTAKKSPAVGAELVAVGSGVVVGVLDLSVDGALAMGAATYQCVLRDSGLLEHPGRWQQAHRDRLGWGVHPPGPAEPDGAAACARTGRASRD